MFRFFIELLYIYVKQNRDNIWQSLNIIECDDTKSRTDYESNEKIRSNDSEVAICSGESSFEDSNAENNSSNTDEDDDDSIRFQLAL